ncbi:LOW QUALITY PROTEIN: G-protein coupled receptor family C group 5 member D [Coregonus clupeaformis]|uniref:LOW QUALITY PROTEIN: G-protein coupled receptor family C group 5 member D n=1 Tax=Coregonus clupeaformis TaxID=59861 RepID=UPI001E1C33FE|nr:LOW QUALITY PROTEIN: G-protein coupled receptor family C group 5 member D [Coregonus clupeaformis]
MVFPFQIHKSIFLILLFNVPLPSTCQTTLNAHSTLNQTIPHTAATSSNAIPNTTTNNSTVKSTINRGTTPFLQRNFSSNSTSQDAILGCGADLDPIYSYLCDRQVAWGIVVESLASLGFVVSSGLLVGLLFWTLWKCVSSRQRRGIGGSVASMALFLVSTAGVFALTFAFVIRLPHQTCPTRLFLFGVLFSLAFSCLLARCLALLGFGVTRGWGESGVALALFTLQVVIATEWLIIVLLRDGQPCQYSQGEFVMLLIYVLVLLATGLVLSLCCLCHSCLTYSYSYSGGTHRQSKGPGHTALPHPAAVRCHLGGVDRPADPGYMEMGRRPQWDDPVLSIALVANGWVLLLGHGLAQVVLLCRWEASSKEGPLDFGGWTSPNANSARAGQPERRKGEQKL